MHLTVHTVQVAFWDNFCERILREKLEQYFILCPHDKPYHCMCTLVSYQLFNQYYLTTILF